MPAGRMLFRRQPDQRQRGFAACSSSSANPNGAPRSKNRASARNWTRPGLAATSRINGATIIVQYRWGYGCETPFPLHDGQQVDQATGWAVVALKALFDHLERRRKVVTASTFDQASGSAPPDFRLAIEQYLEDILVTQWESLDWGADLEYLGRQVPCGTLGRIDILARDRATGDFVVIELKRDQTDDEVIGQLSRYMGWATEHKAAPQQQLVSEESSWSTSLREVRPAAWATGRYGGYRYDLTVALSPVFPYGKGTMEPVDDTLLKGTILEGLHREHHNRPTAAAVQ